MNRRGEYALSVWMFFVIIAISVVLVISASLFYSKTVDTRKAEADALVNKLSNCFSGKMVEEGMKAEFDIYKNCSISKSVDIKGSQIYFNVSFYDSSGKSLKEFIAGDRSFYANCKIGESVKEAEHFPKCSYGRSESFASGKKILVRIIGASNQQGGQVR